MADAHPITRQLSLQQLLLASKGLDQGFPPVVPHALGSLLSRDPSPDCTLTFENGDAPLRLHSLMLQLASPVIHDAVLCAKNCKDSSHGISLGVTGSRAAWIQMAARCYPLMHAPVKDTLEVMLQLFPIAHKYAFQTILDSMSLSVDKLLPSLSGQSTGPTSITAWLQLADTLQMDELKKKLLAKVSEWTDDEIRMLLLDVDGLNKLLPSTLVKLLTGIVPRRLNSVQPPQLWQSPPCVSALPKPPRARGV